MSLYLGDQIVADIPDLSHKADDSAVVHKTGAESISGNKTLTGMTLFANAAGTGGDDEGGEFHITCPPNKSYPNGYLIVDSYKSFFRVFTAITADKVRGYAFDLEAPGLTGVNTVVFITETYKNGNNWYRIWSDGWIEQGGYAARGTINLNKPFSNTEYTIVIQLG